MRPKPKKRRFESDRVGHLLTKVLIKVSDLKRLVKEALIDTVRLPRGPNSRDDAKNRSLDEPASDRPNVEDDPD